PTSLELLKWICDHIQSERMLVISLSRSAFETSSRDQPHITSLTIDRLNEEQVASMVQSLTDGEILSSTIVDQIVAKTDGVPLFVEEMTKVMLESTTPLETSTVRVPDTLHGWLMARLDQAATMKTVAQVAATIGREFSLGLLAEVTPLSQLELREAIDS